MLQSEHAASGVLAPDIAPDLGPRLDVDVTRSGGPGRPESWVLLSGVVDVSTEDLLAACLGALLDWGWGNQIVVDLADVTFVSVSAVRLLADAAARARSSRGTLVVRRPPAGARRMIELFEFGLALPIDDLGL
ncbi:MAG: STAS domain-containing protein [Acidimicrobiales bacterium]